MRIFHMLLSIIASLALAVICGVFLWEGYGYWAIAEYIAIIAALPACSLLHELGHMLFGALAKIKAEPHFKLLGSSGCDLIPKTDKNLRGRVIFTSLGGITVNAICVVLGIVALVAPAVPLWLCVILPASAYLILLNTAPCIYSDGKTDGLIVLEFIKLSDEAKVAIAVLSVQSHILAGQSIEEEDENLLKNLPQIREDDPAFIALTELRYKYYTARGDKNKSEFYKKRFEDLKSKYLD